MGRKIKAQELTKICAKCGKELPNTEEYFAKKYKRKDGTYLLETKCKECKKIESKEYHKNNYEKEKAYRDANAERIKAYRDSRKEATKEYGKKRYQENKEKLLAQGKKWREANREKHREMSKKWAQSPNGQVSRFNAYNKRKMREQNQGNGITRTQWKEMMEYFDWKCAYSGEKLTNNTRTIDHIVPLHNGGRHEIWNLVPMTKSYNSSKQAKEMLEWYREQDFFSEARLAKIYEWQEYAYNKWGKDAECFNTNDIQISLI